MNSQELRALQEAYNQVYELDEVKGIEGHINPNTGKYFYGLDSGLAMTPKKRMETRANSLQKKGEGKRANKIRAVMKRPSMEESFDLYDIILSHLLDEGYADTEQAAEAIMVNMSEEWRGSIVEGIAGRAANAVGHQRAGTLGDDDEIRKNQDSTSASIGKMKRGSGAKITPTLPGV